jgi:hypothetical protein
MKVKPGRVHSGAPAVFAAGLLRFTGKLNRRQEPPALRGFLRTGYALVVGFGRNFTEFVPFMSHTLR